MLQCLSDIDNHAREEEWNSVRSLVGWTSYRGNTGVFLPSTTNQFGGEGIFFFRSNVRLGDITDGTSNTFLLGEHFNAFSRWPEAWGTYGWWAWPNVDTSFDTSYPLNSVLDWYGVPYTAPPAASSGHPGGATFCFADGSVRFTSEQIESWNLSWDEVHAVYRGGSPPQQPRVYQWLSTRSGGEIVTP